MKKTKRLFIFLGLFTFCTPTLLSSIVSCSKKQEHKINEQKPKEIKEKLIPDKTFKIDNNGIITGYLGSDKELKIPEYVVNESGQKIKVKTLKTKDNEGNLIFQNKKITSLTIPNSIENIETGTFLNNPITTLNIDMEDINFKWEDICNNRVSTLILGNSVKFIGEDAFNSNNLTTLTIPNSVKNIKPRAFWANALESLTLGNSLEIIGELAFDSNNLISLTVPDSVMSIGESAFGQNKIENLKLGNFVQTIGNSAFTMNNLKTLEIPNSVIYIGEWAFSQNYELKTEMLTIPDSVIAIGKFAFEDTGIKKVSISSKTKIIDKAFSKEVEITQRQ